jgi:hypothetical protein
MRLRETKEEGTKNMHSISQRELLCWSRKWQVQFKDKVEFLWWFIHIFDPNNLSINNREFKKTNSTHRKALFSCFFDALVNKWYGWIMKREREREAGRGGNGGRWSTLGWETRLRMLTSSINAFGLRVWLQSKNFFLSIILMAYFSPVVLWMASFTVAKFPLYENRSWNIWTRTNNSNNMWDEGVFLYKRKKMVLKRCIRSENFSKLVILLRATFFHFMKIFFHVLVQIRNVIYSSE